jgi:hypothetical protein
MRMSVRDPLFSKMADDNSMRRGSRKLVFSANNLAFEPCGQRLTVQVVPSCTLHDEHDDMVRG